MGDAVKLLHVAYIISMKGGIRSWVCREVDELVKSGIRITLFPTKYAAGVYRVPPEWGLYVYHPLKVALRQPYHFIRQPLLYLRLLKVALRTRSLVDFFLGFDFADQMRHREIDRIHCIPGGRQLFIGYYCKRILGIPLSVAIYGYELQNNPNWAMASEALAICDEIITNCEYNKRLLSEIFGEDKSRAQIIRHWYEPRLDRAGMVQALIVAGFQEHKGYDVLLEAIKPLSNLRLWVVGYPGHLNVQEMVRAAGLADRVTVLGEVSDDVLQILYQACDLFVLPSRTGTVPEDKNTKEGVPVTLIEAMSYGKPVVSTRLGGIPELVEAILVEPGDVNELRAALSRLMDDADLRQRMGERNRQIVAEKYSRDNLTAMMNLLREANKGDGSAQHQHANG
jgi:colanic acid/amylovoran biosynthesis glycosyltransferase